MESNELDQQDIVEAHLHLLLGGYDDLQVSYAIGNYVKKRYPGIVYLPDWRIKGALELINELIADIQMLDEEDPIHAATKYSVLKVLKEIKTRVDILG